MSYFDMIKSSTRKRKRSNDRVNAAELKKRDF